MEVQDMADDETTHRADDARLKPPTPAIAAHDESGAPASAAARTPRDDDVADDESFAAALEAVTRLKAVDTSAQADAFAVSDAIVLNQVEGSLAANRERDDDEMSVASSTDQSDASSEAGGTDAGSEPGSKPSADDDDGGADDGESKRTRPGVACATLTAVRLVVKLLQAVWFEASLVGLLAPYVIGFVSREDEPLRPRWDLWLLRPLYALILGRLGVSVLFGLKAALVTLELLPPSANVFAEAFRGWPATVLVWLGLHAVFYYAPFLDAEAWQRLRDVQWLIAVQWWLAALAISRGLLEASTQRFFSSLKGGHFEQRVADALMSMRVLRLLFATARAARSRAAQREKGPGSAVHARVYTGAKTAVVAPIRHVAAWTGSALGECCLPGRAGKRRGGAGSKRTAPVPAAAADEAAGGGDAFMPGGGGGGDGGGGSGSDAPAAEAPPHGPSRDGSRERQPGAGRKGSRQQEPELMVREDGLLRGSLLGGIGRQLEVLQGAVATGTGFVASTADSRRKARHAFASLHAEFRHELAAAEASGHAPPVDGEGVPYGCIPRERLVRWCAKAMRRKRSTFRRKVRDRATALFNADSVDEERFAAAIEAAYREQRFLSASVQSFDDLNTHVHAFLVTIWAAVLILAGIFLVDLGVDFDAWIVPISSSLLSVAFLLGWLPYETAAGIVFVLVVRPFDIGDRILITNPGVSGEGYEGYTVAKIGLLSTTLVSWQGEMHTTMNFTARKLSVINLHRSHNPTVAVTLQVPASTPGEKLQAMLDAVRGFVERVPEDWASFSSGTITKADYKSGVLELTIYLQSSRLRVEDGLISQAKNRLLMFIHVYMHSAGLEYVQPTQKVIHVNEPKAAE